MSTAIRESSKELQAATEQIIGVGRWLHARGWAPATAGNYSIRLDSTRIAITVSGRDKGRLTADDIMTVDLHGSPLDERRPSAETPLHAVMYRLAPSLRAVLHTHSVPNTVLGLSPARKNALVLEGYELLKVLPGITTHETRVSVPIFDNTQNMAALAQTVATHWDKNPFLGFLIRGHGLYTWGTSTEEALRSVDAFEFLFACELERQRQRP